MKQYNDKKKREKVMKKFSLMELLVVMGILLLMMSLLLPAVGPMMNRADLNRVVTTIVGQLEVGYLKSLDKSQVTRVSFEYDPKGKNISKADVTTISGQVATSAADELAARQSSINGMEFDINNDGISGGYVNKQFLWMKVYLCRDDHLATPKLKDIKDLGGNLLYVGPYWMRRPVTRVKDTSGNFKPTQMKLKPIFNVGENRLFYYRPVINKGLDTEGDVELMPTAIDGTCDLIRDTGAKMDYNLSVSEIKSYVGPLNNTYDDSVALFKSKGGARYQFLYGAAVDAYYLAKPIGPPNQQLYSVTTEWFDVFEGDFVDTKELDYGFNDDEDKLVDEGMSISVEGYNQSGIAPPVILDSTKGIGGVHYRNYFNGIEDHNLKMGREYFVGGKDRKGVMLRRVWGVAPNKMNKELLWSFNEIIKPGGDMANVKMTTPYHFYIVFDQKNGVSGMSFGTNWGSAEVGKLYFQVSDDDNKLYTIIEFANGASKEGDLKEMGFPVSKAGLDALKYYQGAK